MACSRCFIVNQYENIPISIFEVLASVLCLVTVLAQFFIGYKKGVRLVSGLLLAEYVFLLLYKTVLSRPSIDSRGHNFHPFWSYSAFQEGAKHLLSDNIMNVVAFVPVGLLLGCVLRSMTWWKVLLFGGVVSVSIETMQFVLKRGFAETDDVMHNVIGSLMGYGICSLVRYGYERIGKRSARFLYVFVLAEVGMEYKVIVIL